MTKYLDYNGLSHLIDKIKAEFTTQAQPAGVVSAYAGTTAPAGYLICNGAKVSRTTYAKLFAAIGTTYGAGNGSTTFTLPNLSGRVPIGKGSPDSTNTFNLGTQGGEVNHTLSVNEMPTHSHATGTDQDAAEGSYGNSVHGYNGVSSTDGAEAWIYTGAAGANWGHNNMQPYLVLNYIIATG